jgi:hypothetical protein
MGDPEMARMTPLSGSAAGLAEQLAAFGEAGARHLQLVVDPITVESIEWLGEVASHLPG